MSTIRTDLQPAITPEVIAAHGITPDEYAQIERLLGRAPNHTELGVFSVMWSEHCSYKNTRPELKKFPVTGPRVLVKAGEENAGVIDVGDGWGVAFKMESHNHPSAVEPFQGAATGVGGIIRDIFTMGARPVFLLNSLRFGSIDQGAAAPSNRRLLDGVVGGISHYGNCIGIPTIGGEVYFDDSYQGNPLVNVLCLGVLRHEQIARGAAEGVGNPVFYVGAETGRDGLAGAAFASRELTEESKEDRPAVQVGDPFKEKLLLEACLELLATDAVAGIQDMGAAGLTCSTCETASRGGTGVEIDLEKVPLREKGMTPYEILLSESQERMLIIVKSGREQVVREIFEKWELPYAEVGRVTGDGMMRVKVGAFTAVEIPASPLADEAPVYHREALPRPLPEPFDPHSLPNTGIVAALEQLIANPNLASKAWIYQQYDHMVRSGTLVGPGSDAAVFLDRESGKILAATTDCNAVYCALDPREGARIAVAEAVRNLTCTGAIPLALTDNLNFGNPHKPENFWQLREAVEGLAEACRAFDIPVTGGNVSLYNESPVGAIDPTPTVGVVGLIEEEAWITGMHYQEPGDVMILLGGLGHELGGSHFLKICHGKKAGLPPRLDMEKELRTQAVIRRLIREGQLRSAHDLAEGGLLMALAECGFGHATLGAAVTLPDKGQHPEVTLFNESQSRFLLTTLPEQGDHVLATLAAAGMDAARIGRVQAGPLTVCIGENWRFEWDPLALREKWSNALPTLMS